MLSRRNLLAAALVPDLPDIRTVPQDLQTPALSTGAPRPGARVRQTLEAWSGSDVYHALYLPTDWSPRVAYPLIVEYAGNGNYRNQYGDVSLGTPEGSNLGYGISAGRGFVWACLPYVDAAARRNAITWWGDASATVDYSKRAVAHICQRYGGDPARVLLCGFSRGAIACNYIGLRDPEIARLWRAHVCYSHYDGVRTWPYADSGRASALVRLRRLGSVPQFICHEVSVAATRDYLAGAGVDGAWEFHDLPFRNHNDAWTLRDIPLRRRLRAWVTASLGLE
ncbi:MAG: hypothetical protein R2729_14045 [Bryobacteraceae bacterium]